MKKKETQLLTVEEAAAMLGISRSTLYAYVAQKRFPHYRSTKRIYFDPADLDAYMREHLTFITNKNNGEKK